MPGSTREVPALPLKVYIDDYIILAKDFEGKSSFVSSGPFTRQKPRHTAPGSTREVDLPPRQCLYGIKCKEFSRQRASARRAWIDAGGDMATGTMPLWY